MLSDALNMIDGVATYPVVALVLFVLAFGGVLVWVACLSRQQLDVLSRLPLTESDRNAEGDRNDG